MNIVSQLVDEKQHGRGRLKMKGKQKNVKALCALWHGDILGFRDVIIFQNQKISIFVKF